MKRRDRITYKLHANAPVRRNSCGMMSLVRTILFWIQKDRSFRVVNSIAENVSVTVNLYVNANGFFQQVMPVRRFMLAPGNTLNMKWSGGTVLYLAFVTDFGDYCSHLFNVRRQDCFALEQHALIPPGTPHSVEVRMGG